MANLKFALPHLSADLLPACEQPVRRNKDGSYRIMLPSGKQVSAACLHDECPLSQCEDFLDDMGSSWNDNIMPDCGHLGCLGDDCVFDDPADYDRDYGYDDGDDSAYYSYGHGLYGFDPSRFEPTPISSEDKAWNWLHVYREELNCSDCTPIRVCIWCTYNDVASERRSDEEPDYSYGFYDDPEDQDDQDEFDNFDLSLSPYLAESGRQQNQDEPIFDPSKPFVRGFVITDPRTQLQSFDPKIERTWRYIRSYNGAVKRRTKATVKADLPYSGDELAFVKQLMEQIVTRTPMPYLGFVDEIDRNNGFARFTQRVNGSPESQAQLSNLLNQLDGQDYPPTLSELMALLGALRPKPVLCWKLLRTARKTTRNHRLTKSEPRQRHSLQDAMHFAALDL